ncbi:MAG TPA: ABC transporter substrate-binding protein [Kofleriaceae bacterium]
MRSGVLLVLAVACNAPDRGPRFRAAGSTEPRPGGELHVAMKDSISSLDPAIAYDEFSWHVVHPIHDTLVDYDAGTTLVPRLAERWEVAADGLTYRFWLRPGIRYSDGRAIVAADFVTALERVRALETSQLRPFLADVVTIAARGERELAITLARRNAAFIYVMAMPFAAPVTAEHLARTTNDLRRTPLASGPYELVSWDEGQRVILRRNPHYFDPTRQRIERLVTYEAVPRETQFLMFERGELDAIERLSMTAPDYTWISNEPAWAPYIHRRPSLSAFGARFDVRTKPFDDRRVRQALNFAIDRRSTVKLLNGASEPAHGLLPPGAFGRDETLVPYPHDPARARALLAEAGYPDGFAVEYVTIADEDAEKLAQSMQSDLAKVGVRMSIALLSFATYQTAVGKPGTLPFSYQGWFGDFPDPTSFFDPKFHSRAISAESSSNDTRYANPEVDSLLDAARAEVDLDKRAAMYRRVERILYDDAPWIFDYHRMTVEVTQPYVRGYEPHSIWLRDFTSAWIDR